VAEVKFVLLLQVLYVSTKDFTICNEEGDTQFPGMEKEGCKNIAANDSYLF